MNANKNSRPKTATVTSMASVALDTLCKLLGPPPPTSANPHHKPLQITEGALVTNIKNEAWFTGPRTVEDIVVLHDYVCGAGNE